MIITRRRHKLEPELRGSVWSVRYRTPDGKHKRVPLGTTVEGMNRRTARIAADRLRLQVDSDRWCPKTFAELCWHYTDTHLPKTSHNFQRDTKNRLRKYLLPRWETCRLDAIRTVEIEGWLETLTHLSSSTRGALKRTMSILFNHAMRYEWLTWNPATKARCKGASKRAEIPRLIPAAAIPQIAERLKEPYRTLFLLTLCFGGRISESMGLRWRNVDFDNAVLNLEQGWSKAAPSDLKTETSREPVALAPIAQQALEEWRTLTAHPNSDDYVFTHNGRKPLCAENALDRHLKPAAEALGLGKIGWHSLRRTFATDAARTAAMPVVRDLLRHSTTEITERYVQGLREDKRQTVEELAAYWFPDVPSGQPQPTENT